MAADSLKKIQKRRTDSLAAIKKYKESRRYRDSVEKSRKHKTDSLRAIRTHYFDSVKAVRKHTLDSTLAVRKHFIDSVQRKQKTRSDSLALIRKYRESKRARDSVAVVRQSRMDSMRIARKAVADSMFAVRKAQRDSITKIRKHMLDSTTAVRTKIMDSIKVVRQKRADSLAKIKEQKLKDQKVLAKKREDKLKLALDLKIQKKRQAWSNEKMLKKKWTLPRQGFQNTITRYNYYFNAKRKMTEAEDNMRRRKKDNFDERIDLFPFDPNKDSASFTSDMDSIVRKAAIGIQIHDPRTKWGDDLYLLMGAAYYYKGDYKNATTVFRYIIGMKSRAEAEKNKKSKKSGTSKRNTATTSLIDAKGKKPLDFLKHKPAHNDAVLWLTRTYADMGKTSEAESILDLLDASDSVAVKHLKSRIALEKANLYMRRGQYHSASEQLAVVVDDKDIPDYLRQRAAFLNGQLLQEMGNYQASANSFNEVIDLHPAIEMDFYARKNLSYSLMLTGEQQTETVASLKKMLNDGKYAPYYEQVYFILGKLSANSNKPDDALRYLNQSLILPKTTKKQKALTFAAIGNIQYTQGNYPAAKKAYDSASYFARHAPEDEDVKTAILRGKLLDKVEIPFNTIHQQDSILHLASLSEKDQRAALRKYIRYLEKLKEDSAYQAQNPVSAPADAPGMPGSGGGGWYYSSSVAVQQGVADFKRKWGNRPLSDNWRRASATLFGGTTTTGGTTESTDADLDANGLPTEESLLAGIPRTKEQLDNIKKSLRQAYVSLAGAYIKEFEDHPKGIAALDTLDKRFPDHEFGDEVLYLRYLAALKQNQLPLAQQYSEQLLEKYPDSRLAQAIRPSPEDAGNTNELSPAALAGYYDETYQMAMDRQYDEVLKRVYVAKKQKYDTRYQRKFQVLEALSLASTGNYRRADTIISQFIQQYPADSLRSWADAIAKYVTELKAADTVKPATVVPAAATPAKDTVAAAPAKPLIPEKYLYKPNEIHYCVFMFGRPDVKVAGFKSGITDFISFKFSTLKLNVKMEAISADQSFVIAYQFQNAAQAKIFMNAARSEPRLFRDFQPADYQVFTISETNYLKLIADKKTEEYLGFYSKNYR